MPRSENPRGSRIRLIAASVTVSVLTMLAVASSFYATNDLKRHAELLVSAKIPDLRVISALQAEAERASHELHLYYATQATAHWEQVELSSEKIVELLQLVRGSGLAPAELDRLRKARLAFAREAQAFHVEMQTRPGRSWDRMREYLGAAHEHALKMGRILAVWTERTRFDVQTGGEATMRGLRNLSVLQAAFSFVLGGCALALIGLVRARAKDQRELYRLAYFDLDSGLPNRSRFIDEWETTDAESGVALLQVGIDDHKSITGSFGHPLATELARTVADKIRRTMRAATGKKCRVYAISGSEWLVRVPDATPTITASRLAETLLARLEDKVTIEDFEIPFKVSIGIACTPDHGTECEQLLRNTDAALQAARQGSGHGYSVFSLETISRTRKFLDTQVALGDALQQNEFELHLQPKVDTTTLRCIGAEALLRWRRNGELVPPGEFIPVAERSGLIESIGDWVLEEGVRLAKTLRDLGHIDVPVSVNVSPEQLNAAEFCSNVAEALARHDVPAHALELEITEAAMLGGTERVSTLLNELRALGVSLAIDDFGTGYSSLSYLTRFSFDVLKIDRRFISNMLDSDRDQHVVKSILSLASALEVCVIAEGVETDAQVVALQKLGCSHVQGFRYSRAIPLEDFKSLVSRLNEASRIASAKSHEFAA